MDNQTNFLQYYKNKMQMLTLKGITPVPSRQVHILDSLNREVECLYTFCKFLIFPQIPNLIKDNLHMDSDWSNPIRFGNLNHQLTPLLTIQQVVEYPLKEVRFSSLAHDPLIHKVLFCQIHGTSHYYRQLH